MLIYKIFRTAEFQAFSQSGRSAGAPVDLADGYIHMSTQAQLAETAQRHFARRGDLLLLTVDLSRFGDDLLWEPSRGGDLFPHLYAPLEFSAVDFVVPLPLGPDGAHQFPDLETGR